jgi:hypothetical protein
MDIRDVGDQPLSMLLARHHVCADCGVVDMDDARICLGSLCSACGAPSGGGFRYFKTHVFSTIDLMQDIHSMPAPQGVRPRLLDTPDSRHRVAVVIFFCTLGEILLENLLREMMIALGIPPKVQRRLLDDNLLLRERIEKLFVSLVGVKWTTAVRAASTNVDFAETARFHKQTVRTRNQLVHDAHLWSMDSALPDACMDHIEPMLKLFVALHNLYVVPVLRSSGKKHWTARLRGSN